MNNVIKKKLFIIGFLLVFLGSIWLLNQEKNYRPLFSFDTNLTFKSDKNTNYSELSSVIEVLGILKSQNDSFTLNPVVVQKYGVLGREILNNQTNMIVYEYKNSKIAESRYRSLDSKVKDNSFIYKNLLIEGNLDSQYFIDLKEILR
jgi:hypothetical protein